MTLATLWSRPAIFAALVVLHHGPPRRKDDDSNILGYRRYTALGHALAYKRDPAVHYEQRSSSATFSA